MATGEQLTASGGRKRNRTARLTGLLEIDRPCSLRPGRPTPPTRPPGLSSQAEGNADDALLA
eukprot:11019069-Alexandrium_andersonii.AAC.1